VIVIRFLLLYNCWLYWEL